MIVLTGPTGNVGAEVVRLTAETADPDSYRIAAHDPARLRAVHGADLPAVTFDYDDRATWEAVLDGVDTLFLLFPLPSPTAVNTRMKPFIDAAVRAGCRHIVYVSVPGADRIPFVPHYQVERHLERCGASFTILRCGFFMQNLCRRFSTHGVDITEHAEIFVPAGSGWTTFVDSRDVAEVVRNALRSPEHYHDQAYVLTGPQRLDYAAAARILTEELDRPVRYTKPSPARFWRRMRRRGLTRDTVGFMTIVYTLTRFGRHELRSEDLAWLLGREPTTFRRWARDYRTTFEHRAWT